ncbi:MAG: endonuclease/exonuclease/phosphatase family protein [Chitinophagales bacterium]|nr:endonuclease/exonuclease/phosphatase family protein [Chitinophagales bacterium]
MTFIKKFFLFLNLIAAVCLLAGGSCIYLNPAQWWFISFFGLAYPFFLAINLLFLVFWIILKLKNALIPAISILLTLPVLRTYFAFNSTKQKSDVAATTIKILSYNVRNFDVYHWGKENNDLESIIQLIKEEKPAIACFQEFYNADTGKYKTIEQVKKKAGFSSFYFEKTFTGRGGQHWGTAIFSRYPIINHGNIQFDNKTQNSCSYADIQIDSIVVRVFNIHLQSIYLSKEDYNYLEEISEQQDVQVVPIRKIASKVKRAFILRSEQALDIDMEIKKSDGHIIVCGDFNDTPASFAYHTLSNQLQDAFLKAGWGMGPTYAGLLQPYRIDYIFTGDNFELRNYRTIRKTYSDHYAITCEAEIKN